MKEVIFHFFPSVRFLGLGLKILFHKNKEIKRMLSKKMTFSLMSLITLLAFAFVVPSAMAAKITFAVKDVDSTDIDSVDGDKADISAATGIQAEGQSIVTLTVTTDEVLAAVVDGEDEGGTTEDAFLFVQSAVEGAVELIGIVDDGIVRSGDGKTYTITLDAGPVTPADLSIITVSIYLQPNSLMSLTTGTASHDGAVVTIQYIPADPSEDGDAAIGRPKVISANRSDGATHPIFEETFTVIVTLSEEPKEGKFAAANLTVTEADIVSVNFVGSEDIVVGAGEDNTTDNPDATGGNDQYYRYAVTLKPKYEKMDDIKFTVKHFEDQFSKSSLVTPGQDPPLKEKGFKVAESAVTIAATAGTEVGIANDLIIPAGGSLIVAKDDGVGTNSQEKTDSSLIMWPGEHDEVAAKIALRKPNLRTYNVIEAGLPNLETFLISGGTIDLKSADAVVISEIMWATDAGDQNRQWIEIMNTGSADAKTKDYKLVFYAANEVVPVTTVAVAATATTVAVPIGSVPAGVADRVGTLYAGAYWSIAGRGQSGRTSDIVQFGDADIEVVSTSSLVSMQRGAADATGEYPAGTMASSWSGSTPPSLNFVEGAKGLLIGTPGTSPVISAAAATAAAAASATAEAAKTAAAAAAADTSVSMPKVGQIYISEVMFAGGGSLPQWIEISNGSRTEQVNLDGWTLTVENATADADVSVGAKAVFTIPAGTMIDPSGQHATTSTILVVTEQGRNNIDDGAKGAGQIINLWTAQQTELILLGVQKRRYSLLSDMAFQITLAPPVPIVVPAVATPAPTTAAGIAAARAAAATKAAADAKEAKVRADATDVVGNLGADGGATWALPMDEGARSSIIRRHVSVSIGPAEPEDGGMMDSWVLASDTSFAQVTHVRASSYYGSADDVGTPGFRAGGALPVELSHFRPARDKVTGAVVITWSTQSELNNAGFFIKRSQQRDGEFKIINATMIQGAGTSSEKQFYTYQDTTAQPNVVYYYQIEDVSLDGNHQTLTRGMRLKGHVSVAGKLTTTWGDLKTSQ